MSRFARNLVAAVAAASIALTAGCDQQDDGASSPGTTEPSLSQEQRLDAIWQGNVVSADREAVCALDGDERMQSFRSYVDPWLVGLPAESMPTDAEMAGFIDSSCTTQ